jgi:predicted nucleotidyltransferase
MKTEEVIQILRYHKADLTKKYPLKSLALFGSYARNEQTESSDIDVMVEFSEPVGMEFIDLLIDLEHIFKRKIDLISRKGIKPHYLPYIEEDAIYV